MEGTHSSPDIRRATNVDIWHGFGTGGNPSASPKDIKLGDRDYVFMNGAIVAADDGKLICPTWTYPCNPRGTPMVLEQIKNQLERLVPVHRVVDMTIAGPSIQRELAMVKVRGKGEHRVEALRLADAFRARVIDAGPESFVFEITGAGDKIESFINLMLPLGLVEVSRTGIVAISRGAEGM